MHFSMFLQMIASSKGLGTERTLVRFLAAVNQHMFPQGIGPFESAGAHHAAVRPFVQMVSQHMHPQVIRLFEGSLARIAAVRRNIAFGLRLSWQVLLGALFLRGAGADRTAFAVGLQMLAQTLVRADMLVANGADISYVLIRLLCSNFPFLLLLPCALTHSRGFF